MTVGKVRRSQIDPLFSQDRDDTERREGDQNHEDGPGHDLMPPSGPWNGRIAHVEAVERGFILLGDPILDIRVEKRRPGVAVIGVVEGRGDGRHDEVQAA